MKVSSTVSPSDLEIIYVQNILHVTLLLFQLHWIPFKSRVHFKILALTLELHISVWM